MTEAVIRQRIADIVKAVAAKDIDAVLAIYAPDVVSFDIGPPLRYAAAANKRRAWEAVFAAYADIAYEVHELGVAIEGELAFVHSINRVSGTLASGRATAMWLRWTACFRRIDGVWLVVHDHVSVPADLAHGAAMVNLTP